MNQISTNLVSVGQQEEATGFAQQLIAQQGQLPQVRNCAIDPDCVNFVLSTLVPALTWTRSNRSALEGAWREIREMEQLRHNSNQRYRGRSQAYLPVYLRALNTQVTALSRGLFPSDEYCDVVPRLDLPGKSQQAKAIKSYLQWEFERNAKLRTNMKPFLRSLAGYGNAVLKFDYRKETRQEGRLTSPGNYSFMPCSYEGLRVVTRSIFNCYVYPVTASTPDEVQIYFEDVDVPRAHIEEMGRKQRWANVEAALNSPVNPYHNTNQIELLSTSGNMSMPVGPLASTELDIRTLTECWVYMRLPQDQYLPGEDVMSPLLAKVVLAGNEPVEIIRCPFFHQRAPYLWARVNVEPGLFYGYGIGKAIAGSQYLANDFANQTNDCGTYTLNPIAKVNPGLLAGPMPALAPGKVIPLTNVNEGLVFDRPPGELIQYGQSLTNQWIQYGQDMSGTPPVLQGQSDAGTATSTQILQRNASQPLQDMIEDLENDIMEPLMYGAWTLAQQFREQEVMLTVAGQPLAIAPKDLILDAEFRWLAANQAANQQQRASQTVQFIQVLPPLIPLLQAQGKMVNVEVLLQRLYTDGLGFRNFDQVIVPAPPPPPMGGPGGMPPSGMPPPGMGIPPQGMPPPGDMPPGAPQSQDPLSATEQIPGNGPQDMVPGEGEDYGAIRDQANELAGLAGGDNGKDFGQ